MTERIRTPLVLYVVHHPECSQAEALASRLYDWFRLSDLAGDSAGAGLPVYYRRQLKDQRLHPAIDFDAAQLNVVIALVDHRVVVDASWRDALLALAGEARARKNNREGTVLLLPAALHDSFYRTGRLYEGFNPVRLLDMADDVMLATIRRASTEATARVLRAVTSGIEHPPPLDVFLSHAKRDGMRIAESIRDGVRKFGQLQAWYDANDLPYGSEWESPLKQAAASDTAAMIATVTDAYPTRPWCRREATLARTPSRVEFKQGSAAGERESSVWKVQPVVAIHQPGPGWVRGVPMLEGVPRIGWDPASPRENTARIVDRLVLEVLLGHVHRSVALELDLHRGNKETCFITWVPDAWTLAVLRQELAERARRIRKIVYPGYGLTTAEISELEPVVKSFHNNTKLLSFEEAWS